MDDEQQMRDRLRTVNTSQIVYLLQQLHADGCFFPPCLNWHTWPHDDLVTWAIEGLKKSVTKVERGEVLPSLNQKAEGFLH